MRKASKYFLIPALAIMTLAGCSNEDTDTEVTNRQDTPDFTATIADVQTRAFDQSWESGDEIGISGANRTNVCYHTESGNGNFAVKKYGDQIYFQHDGATAFTAYYPWNNLNGGATTIEADTRAQANQKRFDFLWAQASGKKEFPKVAFTFAHKMAKVSLTVKPGNGMSYDEAKKARLSLNGFRHTGSFNVTDGNTTVKDGSEAWTFTNFAHFNDAERTVTFSFIFFPQTLNKLEFLAELELAGSNMHSLRAEIDFTAANREKDGPAAKNEWVAGRQYNLSVTLNKTDITEVECAINPWNEVKGDEIIVD
ncbi:MAG: fimbrillin family protein [Bacteroidaceae bacterium]|nr:fimbrillin family protein [Bacteroidaceae bacterium]